MVDESNGTFGQLAPRLLANGYSPTSLLAHRFGGASGLLAADDPACVLTWPQDVAQRLCVLVINTPDTKRRAAIWHALETRSYRGPVRTGSDGSEWLIFSAHCHEPPAALVTADGALMLLAAAAAGPGMGVGSCAVPISGAWRGASLLDTPRSALPAYEAHTFARLFAELQPAIRHVEPPKYVPRPLTAVERANERELAEFRKDPRSLLALFDGDMRGLGQVQVAARASLLCAVAETGNDVNAARAWLANALRTKAAA